MQSSESCFFYIEHTLHREGTSWDKKSPLICPISTVLAANRGLSNRSVPHFKDYFSLIL